MSDEIKTTDREQPTTPTPEASGGQGEKLFTQDEVNRIVSERLAREREKLTQQPKEDERETALREREKAVEARETRYRCEDYLKEINLSTKYRQDFLDVLDTTNFDTFKKIVDRLGKPFIVNAETRGANVPHPTGLYNEQSLDAQIAQAFKPKF